MHGVLNRNRAALILDKNGKIIGANSEFMEKIGYNYESILNVSVSKLMPEECDGEHLQNASEIVISGVDGGHYPLLIWQNEKEILAFEIGEISAEIKRRYAGVWNFHYGFIFISKSKRIIAANDTFYRTTGLEKIEGKTLEELVPDLIEDLRKILLEGAGEITVKLDGKQFNVRLKVREVEILGVKVYEVLTRTLDDERVRNFRKIFSNLKHPAVLVLSGKPVFLNKAAEEVFAGEDIVQYIKEKTFGRIEARGRSYSFFKIPNEEIYVFIDEKDEAIKVLEDELLKYRLSFENSVDAIIIVDATGKIQHANAAVKLHGYTPEELVGRNVLEFIHPEQAEFVLKSAEEGKSSGKFRRVEVRIKDKSGKFRWVEVVGVPIKRGEEITGGVLVIRDVTSKKELEKRLIESEKLYRTLAENSHSGIYVIQDNELVYMNKATQDYTGYTLDEIKKEWWKVFDEKAWENAKKAVQEALMGKVVRTYAKYYTKSGEKRYATFVLSPITFRGRRAVLGNFIDVTSAVIAEKKLREREELYRSLTENSHTGIFIIQDDKIVYGNKRLQEITGYTIEEVNSLEHPYKILHPDFFDTVVARYRARERGERVPDSYEVKIITKDGKEKWLKILASRIKYKGRPAVMTNVADITDLKETEEMLKRLNLLMSATGECSREISRETSEFRILNSVRKHLEKAGFKVAVYFCENEVVTVGVSEGLDEEECRKVAERNLEKREAVLEDVCGMKAIVLPVSNGRTHGIIIALSDRELTDEEIKIITTLGIDVSYAFTSLRISREKEAAMKVIMENIEHFENLADRLRNPLAIIKGYVEVREAFSYDEFATRIEHEANRIEEILDELRAREIATYELKKILES